MSSNQRDPIGYKGGEEDNNLEETGEQHKKVDKDNDAVNDLTTTTTSTTATPVRRGKRSTKDAPGESDNRGSAENPRAVSNKLDEIGEKPPAHDATAGSNTNLLNFKDEKYGAVQMFPRQKQQQPFAAAGGHDAGDDYAGFCQSPAGSSATKDQVIKEVPLGVGAIRGAPAAVSRINAKNTVGSFEGTEDRNIAAHQTPAGRTTRDTGKAPGMYKVQEMKPPPPPTVGMRGALAAVSRINAKNTVGSFKGTEDRNAAAADAFGTQTLPVQTSGEVIRTAGVLPHYKDQIQEVQPEPPSSIRTRGTPTTVPRINAKNTVGSFNANKDRNAPSNNDSRRPAARLREEQTPTVGEDVQQQTPSNLPIAAQVVGEDNNDALEARLRQQILEGAARAEVVALQDSQSMLLQQRRRRTKSIIICIGIFGLLLIVGAVIGALALNDGTSTPSSIDPTRSPSTAPTVGPPSAPSSTSTPSVSIVPTRSPSTAPTISFAPTSSPSTVPSASFPPTMALVPVTVVIELDSMADETGWSMVCDGVNYASYPARSYSFLDKEIEETLYVAEGSLCTFTITDAAEDGIGFYNDDDAIKVPSHFWIYLAEGQVDGTIIAEGAGNFGAQDQAIFTAVMLVPPTAAPTASPAPTRSSSPTAPPTMVSWPQIGENLTDASHGFGDPIALSGDGSIVAVAATFTRILEYDQKTLSWHQLGQDILGFPDDSEEKFITLSGSGRIVAVGATRGNEAFAGTTRIFQYRSVGNSWSQLGRTLDGPWNQDETLTPLSLSDDGSMIAIGERDGPPVGDRIGRVKVYSYNSTDWFQVGDSIVGEEERAWFGNAVSLSSDGSIVAVGAPFHSGGGGESGYRGRTQIFAYLEGGWQRLGQPIDGKGDETETGTSVSLSGDGTTVAIGSLCNEVVRVYRLAESGNSWLQLGEDILSFGISVSLSSDGNVLAIGGLDYNPYVLHFDIALADWKQFGPDIVFTENSISVSLSDNGSVMAVGDGDGQVNVYGRITTWS